MAHKRLLDPRIFKDEIFLKLTQKQALMYLLLWDYVESNGCGKANAKLIKADVLPFLNYTRRFVAETINKLAELDLILLYEYGNQAYFYLRRFEEYQGFKNPLPSRIKGPEGNLRLKEIDTETDNGLPNGHRRKKYTRKNALGSIDNNINNNKNINNNYTFSDNTENKISDKGNEEKKEKGKEENEQVIHKADNKSVEVVNNKIGENVENSKTEADKSDADLNGTEQSLGLKKKEDAEHDVIKAEDVQLPPKNPNFAKNQTYQPYAWKKTQENGQNLRNGYQYRQNQQQGSVDGQPKRQNLMQPAKTNPRTETRDSSFDTDEFFNAALRRSEQLMREMAGEQKS